MRPNPVVLLRVCVAGATALSILLPMNAGSAAAQSTDGPDPHALEYGFRDAINLTEGWVAPIWMGLNQAPVTVMIENHRTGLPWRLFMANEDVKRAVEAIAAAGGR